MKRICWVLEFCFICGLVLISNHATAQSEYVGHPIGSISTDGNLIILELNDGALGRANLHDLAGRTLRFTPEGSKYRVANTSLQWDREFGPALEGPDVRLHNFSFPFSGKQWDSFVVGTTGFISFGDAIHTYVPGAPPLRGRREGISIGRFDELAEAAGALVNTIPAICVFLKPRMSGTRYAKELADRVVITWDLTEPFGNIQDFTWFKTVNRFQAVLHSDGSIEMSYEQLAAKDAIVGLYPMLAGVEKPITTIVNAPHPDVAAHLDVRSLKVSVIDDLVLKITFETRGPVLPEGDPAVEGIRYRVSLEPQSSPHSGAVDQRVVWTARGFARPNLGSRYFAFGPGASQTVRAAGNTISLEGTLPPGLRGVTQVAVRAEVAAGGDNEQIVERLLPHTVSLPLIRNPEVKFSSLTPKDGPFAIAYESFHYLSLPRPEDLSCTVINTLGDKFDFLAYYSDFRIDNQEAGTPSDGPEGGNVTGIAALQHDLQNYCTQGRFQWEFIQPVYAGANQMQEWPPEGAPVGGDRDITFYAHQLGEISPDGKMLPYNYAMSQIGHEMGHRWAAFVSAKVHDEKIQLGPTHWARGLQARVAFPYQRPTEASAMGGGVWQDNFDGTYTQLDDDYYVPATGYSYLDLYLMGLITAAEVPDFFILKNLVRDGKDLNGHPIFKADRTKVTIQDVIASEGPRLPDVQHSQRRFNTGIVVVVEHGKKPSRELMEHANGIREQWIYYWAVTTGHRASMTANSR
ncbi:MAG: hypothetical protein ACRD2U_11040 [Terriglobales bacterium]